jgi:hypothetical protein
MSLTAAKSECVQQVVSRGRQSEQKGEIEKEMNTRRNDGSKIEDYSRRRERDGKNRDQENIGNGRRKTMEKERNI